MSQAIIKTLTNAEGSETIYPRTTKEAVYGLGNIIYAHGDEVETEVNSEYLKSTPQELSDAQKAQVRTNIGAISSKDISHTTVSAENGGAWGVHLQSTSGNIQFNNTNPEGGAGLWLVGNDSPWEAGYGFIQTYDKNTGHYHQLGLYPDGVVKITGNLWMVNNPIAIAEGGTGARTAEAALANLGGISMVKLWENASPGSAFGAQTVAVDWTKYDAVMILCYYISDTNAYTPPAFLSTTATNKRALMCGYEGYYRYCSLVDGGVNFEGGKSSDAYWIPYQIYGIKGVL